MSLPRVGCTMAALLCLGTSGTAPGALCGSLGCSCCPCQEQAGTSRGNEEFLSGRLLLSRLCCFNGKEFKKLPLVVKVNECVIISLSPTREAVRGLIAQWVICTVPAASVIVTQVSGGTSAPGTARRGQAELLCPSAVQRTCISISRCLAFLLHQAWLQHTGISSAQSS